MNLTKVATIPINAETGTAQAIFNLKNIINKGILIPAPDNPPAFDIAITKNIDISPNISSNGF